MCGLFGGFGLRDSSYESVDKITKSIIHRGPDDYNFWKDPNIDFFLSFRRLSIIDLSVNGNQPMISKSKNLAIVFNGEIYNFLDLKKEVNQLKNIDWKGYSDTEVLLEMFDLWGVDKTLTKIDGMFSIGLWDLKNKKLYIIVDRFGEKPMYYYRYKNKFFFFSDLKILKNLKVNLTLDQKAINLYFKYNCIPAPFTIFKEC